MLAYIAITGLLFCTAMLFMGWRDGYDNEDTAVILGMLACSLLWPITIVCVLVWLAGKSLLRIGHDLRCLWELRRKP